MVALGIGALNLIGFVIHYIRCIHSAQALKDENQLKDGVQEEE